MLHQLEFQAALAHRWGGFCDLAGLRLIHDDAGRLYRLTLAPVPATHHLVAFLDLLMRQQDWSRRALRVIEVGLAPGERAVTIPRAVKFCKRCHELAGLGRPDSAPCGHGVDTTRLEGQWSLARGKLLPWSDAPGHQVLRAPPARAADQGAGPRSATVDVLVTPRGAPFQVTLRGGREPLLELQRAFRGARRGSRLRLGLTGQVLSALESGATALQTAALRHHLDRWGELSVVHGPILSEVRDELAGDAREEGDYLVTLDDELLAGATAWRSRSELELQAVRWFDRLGLEARKQVRVKELLEVEVRLLRLQEPSRYSLASVARGSTALLRMPRGLASSLQREGLGLCGTQLGLPVSVTRPEDWLPAQRPAPDGVRGERGAGGRVAES